MFMLQFLPEKKLSMTILCQPCFRKVKNIIEFRALSLATLSAQELLMGETRMKRVRGSQQVGESPCLSQQAKKTSLNRENIESVHSARMCLFGLFVEGDQHHGKNPPQFRPIAPKNITTAPRRLPEFLQGDKERHDATKIQVSESPADRSIQADIMRQSGLRKYQVREILLTFDFRLTVFLIITAISHRIHCTAI